MGQIATKSKSTGDAIVRRRGAAVAAFRRDRRSDDQVCALVPLAPLAPLVPSWGRIVFRSGRTILR